ncbi:MAG: hypothetical protein DI603_14115 [Roseateles depolymerans]|uniref:MAPEG family protein n=1 Tax=Roseateles depolymerans TaxID=76731 RepID=A0A2W5FMA9_9BURK|nr:MAG: hypothetical protein DI603_14115 [Roseateles depolymerans]
MPSVHPLALACTALLGLLLFGLGLAVSGLRFRAKHLCGCSSDPADPLHRASRAHGNTAEYAPYLAVAFLYLGAHQPSTLSLGLIVAATASRVLLAIGLIAWPSMARPNPLRFIGALGTYATGIALSLQLLGAGA